MKFRDDSGEDSKAFVKLKDGGMIYGVLRGDIYEFRQHWVNGRSEVCPEKDCPLCAEAGNDKKKKASFRFRLNMIVNEDGNYVPKVFEQGWKVYSQLRELHKEYELEKTLIKVTRSGSGPQDTEYMVVPAAKQVTAAQLATISKIELLDVSHDATPESEPQEAQGQGGFTEDDIPF